MKANLDALKRSFRTDQPLSIWADYARSTGSIAEAERIFASMRG
jgi:hypothetical protein